VCFSFGLHRRQPERTARIHGPVFLASRGPPASGAGTSIPVASKGLAKTAGICEVQPVFRTTGSIPLFPDLNGISWPAITGGLRHVWGSGREIFLGARPRLRGRWLRSRYVPSPQIHWPSAGQVGSRSDVRVGALQPIRQRHAKYERSVGFQSTRTRACGVGRTPQQTFPSHREKARGGNRSRATANARNIAQTSGYTSGVE
jgi:hypothetical protein